MNRLVSPLENWYRTSTQKQKWTVGFWALGILCTLGLFALDGNSGASADPLGSTPLYFLSVFVKLVVVLLLIVASSLIFRRWLRPGSRRTRSRQVQLLETIRLSPRQALHLVAVGEQHLLLGATDQGIALLAPVEALTLRPPAQPGADFISLLQTFEYPGESEISA